MKPKDLKPLFTWETRHVFLEDRILYVPAHLADYATYTLPAWEDLPLFGNQNPVMVEFCSGNGHWLVEQASQQPELNWLAVEMRFDRVRKIWAKCRNAGLENVVIVSGEAHTAVRHYFPDRSLAGAFVNFPDPWPKRRHRKHRLLNLSFFKEVWRVLQHGAQLTLVTDDRPYLMDVLRDMTCHPGFAPLHRAPYLIAASESYGYSWFSALWQRLGRPIYRVDFRRC